MVGSKTTVGLVQIGELIWERRPSRQFHLLTGALRPKPNPPNSHAASLAYLPHSVAVLETYCRAHASRPGSYKFLLPLYKRLPLAQAVAHLRPAQVVGFSVYVWNIQFSLAVARELKRQCPEVLIVMGGPQVPDAAEPFLRANPFVDLACHGEGERTFLEVLEQREGRLWAGIQSTSYLDTQGHFVANPRRPRMVDLDEIPSPMLDGTYERLMRSVPSQEWLATWETNRGCPFTCTFCDWGSATGSKVSRYGEERLCQEIEWLAEHGMHHLCVCDANFGMLPRDVEIARRLADTYRRHGLYLAISIQNTKNRTDRSEAIQRIFKESRVVSFGASVSLQSVDHTVLKAIERDNISIEAFERLQRHYASEGLDTYSDLIVGLPAETYKSFTEGIGRVIGNGQLNRIAFYECTVLPNAPMARREYREAFEIETVPVRIVHAHEPLDRNLGGESEFLQMVVSTSTMKREDWIRARVFAYLVDLLFFDRLLHIPLTLLGVGAGLDYRDLIEAFLHADPSECPVTCAARRTLENHARSMVNGGEQYVASREWLNLWWPADQYALIDLVQDESIDAFYEESEMILIRCPTVRTANIDPLLISDAVLLNRAAFALPFQLCDEVVETTYSVADDYHRVLTGRNPVFARRRSRCEVERSQTIWMSWNDWCEDLVRRVFLPANYLYPMRLSGDDCGPAVHLATSQIHPSREELRH